jgi:hypothetical protein
LKLVCNEQGGDSHMLPSRLLRCAQGK